MYKQNFNQKLPNPQHIKSFQLAYICSLLNDNQYQITISPKANGTYSLFKYKSEHIFESENMGNYKLVFDSIHYPIVHDDTLFSRSKWIRSLHPIIFNNNYEAFTITDIYRIIEYDNSRFDEFINLMNKKNIIEWFPKTTILLKNFNPKDFLKILDQKPKTNYETDGWILTVYYKNKGQIKLIFGYPLKVKPEEDMTIDLFYNGNNFITSDNTIINVDIFENIFIGIWRCKYDKINKKWYPVNFRHDKYKPNNDYIANIIIKYHQYPWIPSSIFEYINNDAIYYPNKFNKLKVNSVLEKFLQFRRIFISLLLNKIIYNGCIILDIGCGNGSILKYIKHVKYKKYIGIDKDYRCLVRCSKNIRYNDSVIWGDITQHKWNYFEDVLYDNIYDIIVCINVIHYINDKIKMDSFFENISKISKKGTKFFLVALDSTKMKSCNLSDNEFAVKHIKNDKFYFKYPWIEKNFYEIIPPLDNFIDQLIKNNWLEIELFNSVHFPKFNNVFDQYNSFHVAKLFTRIK